MAFQVKSKSAEVIGDPSAQTALSLILYVMVNGFSVSNPFFNEGASRNSGEATKLPFGSSCMALGRTCSRTVYQVHGDDAHWLMGLMHSGHCSAPNTADPPSFGWTDDAELVGSGVPPPVQAAVMTARTATTQALWRPICPPSGITFPLL